MTPAPDPDRLVLDNLRLAWHEARRLRRICPAIARLPDEDACAAGVLGLVRAARLYDPSRGYAFSTFATYLIRHQVQEEALKAGVISLPSTMRSHDRSRIKPHILAAANRAMSPMASIVPGRGRGRGSPSEAAEAILLDRQDTTLADHEDREDDAYRVRRLLAVLPRRYRRVMERVYLDGASRQQVAREMGLSRTRIGQIVTEAVERMRREVAVARPRGGLNP